MTQWSAAQYLAGVDAREVLCGAVEDLQACDCWGPVDGRHSDGCAVTRGSTT
jgi:hypothetical protein